MRSARSSRGLRRPAPSYCKPEFNGRGGIANLHQGSCRTPPSRHFQLRSQFPPGWDRSFAVEAGEGSLAGRSMSPSIVGFTCFKRKTADFRPPLALRSIARSSPAMTIKIGTLSPCLSRSLATPKSHAGSASKGEHRRILRNAQPATSSQDLHVASGSDDIATTNVWKSLRADGEGPWREGSRSQRGEALAGRFLPNHSQSRLPKF